MIYGLIGQLILILCMLIEHETSLKPYLYTPIRSLLLEGNISGNPPLWFLPSLFTTQFLFAFLREKKINLYLCALIGMVGGLLLMLINCRFVPVYIGSGIFGVCYFAMGRILHKYERNCKVLVGVVVFCAVLLLIDQTPTSNVGGVAQFKGTMWDYFHGVGVALCGCFIIDTVFFYLQSILKFPLLRWVGRNAMDFYVLHWIVLLIVSRLLMGDILHVWDEKLQFIITGIGCLLVIPAYIIIKDQWIKRTVH